MSATLTAQRRTLPTPPRPLRELPVLFHLMDVSRPKGYATAATPVFKLADDEFAPITRPPLHQPLSAPFSAEVATDLAGAREPSCPAESFDLETAAELVQTKAYGSLPSETPLADVPSPVTADAAKVNGEPNSPESSVGEIESPSGLQAAAPDAQSPVTLRERAEERKRKRQEAKKDDWFRTQGRFILIGFFIALVVTIYVARTGRKPSGPPVTAKREAASAQVAGTAKASPTVKQAAAVESAKITSVHPTAKKTVAASEPKTALHPPTIPQLQSEPAAAKAGADATLFTFTRRTEERVAARSDEAASLGAGPGTGSTATAGPPTASPAMLGPAAPATPSLQPQYPATNYPGQYQPPAAPAGVYAPPATYAPPPATYAPPPATYAPGSAPAGPALGPAASTMPLYPTTNTASGYRYERTGSSVY